MLTTARFCIMSRKTICIEKALETQWLFKTRVFVYLANLGMNIVGLSDGVRIGPEPNPYKRVKRLFLYRLN